jgi:glutamyl-tRNA synthetase
MTVRTRIEPSPSGSLHVGNAMTAMFNWLWARKHGGTFILRIADTDVTRVTAEGIRSALEDLRWLGLQWDEGPEVGGPNEPYFQSKRQDLYREAGERLLAQGHAYLCYCTPEELKERRELALKQGRAPMYDRRCRDLTDAQRRAFEIEGRSALVRFRVPDGTTTITDLVRGEVTFEHAHIEDFGILRGDGTPLYMLSAAYDDAVMRITHVVRGDDIFSNTPKQILLMRALGYDIPVYAHLPLIVGPDGSKLSKRHGATHVAEFRRRGILPETMLNYLAIINWSAGGDRERFTVDELIAEFDLARVTRNPSAFDPVKLEALNGEKIRSLPTGEFIARLQPFLDGIAVEPEVLAKIAPHVQERMRRLDEASGQVRFLVEDVEADDKARAVLTAETKPLLQQVVQILQTLEPWSVETITSALTEWADGTGQKRKAVLQPLRAAVTGSLVSPPLFESIEALGRDEAVRRLARYA